MRRTTIIVALTAAALTFPGIQLVHAGRRTSAEPLHVAAIADTESTTEQEDFEAKVLSPEFIKAQERLDALAESIAAVDTAGQLATSEVDQDSLTLTVRVAGELPTAMKQAADAADDDITVRFESASFSMRTMQMAHPLIHKAVADGLAPMYSTIVSNNDGSGLTVTVLESTLERYGAEKLAELYSSAADLPATVREGDSPEPTTRGNDAAPWRGGLQIVSTADLGCSVAFSVLRPGGLGRQLSASHCDPHGNWR